MKKILLGFLSGFVTAMIVAEFRGLNNLWDGDLHDGSL